MWSSPSTDADIHRAYYSAGWGGEESCFLKTILDNSDTIFQWPRFEIRCNDKGWTYHSACFMTVNQYPSYWKTEGDNPTLSCFPAPIHFHSQTQEVWNYFRIIIAIPWLTVWNSLAGSAWGSSLPSSSWTQLWGGKPSHPSRTLPWWAINLVSSGSKIPALDLICKWRKVRHAQIRISFRKHSQPSTSGNGQVALIRPRS